MRVMFKRNLGRENPIKYQYPGDAGFDIPICVGGVIPGRRFSVIETGIILVEFHPQLEDGNDGYALDIRPRSGLCRGGVQVFPVMYFESDCGKEILLPVYSALDTDFHYEAGYRLAQGVLCRLGTAAVFQSR